jgi:hypothetical protein
LDGAAFQVPDVVPMFPDAGYWEKEKVTASIFVDCKNPQTHQLLCAELL